MFHRNRVSYNSDGYGQRADDSLFKALFYMAFLPQRLEVRAPTVSEIVHEAGILYRCVLWSAMRG